MEKRKFTYPFCYTPDSEIVKAAQEEIVRIQADEELKLKFIGGKMLGVMKVEDSEGKESFIYGFSGLAAGTNRVKGFVPPIFDLLDPQGHFKKTEKLISEMNIAIKKGTEDADYLKRERKRISEELQDYLFTQYVVLNAKGEKKSIKEIFADEGLVPPGGTGECAAPKMLQYAYLNKLKPLAMGEFWYGASPQKEVRTHACFYPSCTGKCGPLLRFMLKGLDVESNPLEGIGWECDAPKIIYEDDYLLVADKPSGMLSVPGRLNGNCLQNWLISRSSKQTELLACHRLDMDTSGLIVFAKNQEVQTIMEGKFARHQVCKKYLATLISTGTTYKGPMEGTIDLPLILDWYDRPRQMVDFENGKKSVTEYEILEVRNNGELRVLFTPLTGRTHQLRVHAAHHLGLGRPIKGDRLYGGFKDSESGKLHLRAIYLSFEHPVSGEKLTFDLK